MYNVQEKLYPCSISFLLYPCEWKGPVTDLQKDSSYKVNMDCFQRDTDPTKINYKLFTHNMAYNKKKSNWSTIKSIKIKYFM